MNALKQTGALVEQLRQQKSCLFFMALATILTKTAFYIEQGGNFHTFVGFEYRITPMYLHAHITESSKRETYIYGTIIPRV